MVEPLQTRQTCDDGDRRRKNRQVMVQSASSIGWRDVKRLKSCLVLWRARFDGKRMNFACHFFGQELIDHAMALDPRFTSELRRDDVNSKMTLSGAR